MNTTFGKREPNITIEREKVRPGEFPCLGYLAKCPGALITKRRPHQQYNTLIRYMESDGTIIFFFSV